MGFEKGPVDGLHQPRASFAIKRVISIHLESRIATPSGRHEPPSRGRAEEFHRLLSAPGAWGWGHNGAAGRGRGARGPY